MKIRFESIKDDARAKAWYPGSQIREIGNIMSDPNSMALTYGRLQHLFGEPFYTSDDLEDAYDYLILGTDEEGNTYQLTAYHGPTGPAIGGDSHDPQVAKAAEELEKYINEADYVDYDYEGVYHDFDVIVKFGIRDGVPYMEETGMDGEELDYSEFEF